MVIQRKIVVRVTAVFIIGIAFVLFFANNFYLESKKKIDLNSGNAELINLAGRQRMLSQKITKNVFLKTLQEDTTTLSENDSLMNLFQRSHEKIVSLSNEVFINPSFQSSIKDKVASVQILLESYLDVARASELQNPTSHQYLRTLQRLDTDFLREMDELVSLYEYNASLIISQSIADLDQFRNRVFFSVISSATGVLLLCLWIINAYAKSNNLLKSKLLDANELSRKKVERLELLTNSIKVGIWEKDVLLDEEVWSKRLFNILGYEQNEIEGTSENFIKHVHPEDVDKLQIASNESIKRSTPKTIEIRVKRKDGQFIWVEATGNSRRNNKGKLELLIAGVLDVNDKKILEQQLKTFVQRAPAAIAMLDTQMNYLAVSYKWLDYHHIENDSLVGKNHYLVFADSDEKQKLWHQRSLEGEIISGEIERQRLPDDTYRYEKWEIRPWYVDTETVGGLMMITEDITAQIEQIDQLETAKSEAEKISEERSEFLAAMSHEIRSPLNGILGIADVLSAEKHLPEQEHYLKVLKGSGENLMALINDILDLNKIDSGNITLNETDFDSKDFILSVANAHAFSAKSKGILFHLNLDDYVPSVLLFDKSRLFQVLNNLLSNAIKFTDAGQVSLFVKMLTIDDTSCQLLFEVSDTGIGIAPDKQEQIFDPYKQADQTVHSRYGGTGLGLYISKQLIELFGSSLTLDSEPGRGSSFSFTINAKIGNRASINQPKDANEHKTFIPTSSDASVLVVEDNNVNQLIMKKIISDFGVEAIVAESGKQGIEILKNTKVQLVLMDIQLPDMSGMSCTEIIRNELALDASKLPIVAVTADVTDDIRNTSRVLGIQEILYKPLTRKELFSTLNKYLKTTRVDAQLEKLDPQKIDQALDYYCGSDEELREQMLSIMANSLAELQQKISWSVDQKDPQVLRDIRHKMVTTLKVLQISKLDLKLRDLQTSFDQGQFDKENSQIAINEAHNLESDLQNYQQK